MIAIPNEREGSHIRMLVTQGADSVIVYSKGDPSLSARLGVTNE